MTIELTPEHERIIEHVLQSRSFQDAKDVIGAALEALADDLNDVVVTKARKQELSVSVEEVQATRRSDAIEQLKVFGKTQGLSLGGMTIRQLRHESRP